MNIICCRTCISKKQMNQKNKGKIKIQLFFENNKNIFFQIWLIKRRSTTIKGRLKKKMGSC